MKPPSQNTDLQKDDMQGLIVRGYRTLRAATYILLKITDATAAKQYFSFLVDNGIITNENTNRDEKKINKDPDEAVNIAFTSSGISHLTTPEVLATFSREFIEGMSVRRGTYQTSQSATGKPDPEERAILLGDQDRNHPDLWQWGNEKKPVDAILMVYAQNRTALDELINRIYCNKRQGVETVYVAGTYEYGDGDLKEHFGFMDGISQPIIKGLGKEKNITDKSTLINAGEFILGYHNEYNHFSPSPYVDNNTASVQLNDHPVYTDKKDLGANGTYLVFRQMEQYVERFWKYLYDNSRESAASQTEKAVKLGAKMVGRWPDGKPLVLAPSAACPVSEADINDFEYAETDKHGVMCPLGSHIRRTNPRDHMHSGRDMKDSFNLSKKHRMLRRGRIYGEPLDKEFNVDNMIHHSKAVTETDTPNWNHSSPVTTRIGIENEKAGRGLHFICLVSDISRQFEFVQNVWANTSTFGNLCNEVDPIISPRPTEKQPTCHEFTTPQEIVRNRYLNVPEFTRVMGGAYFFMPGITALKYIVT
jgi:Dyp-type peroxidase family